MHDQLANILQQRSQLVKIMVNIISLLFRKYRMFYTHGRNSKYLFLFCSSEFAQWPSFNYKCSLFLRGFNNLFDYLSLTIVRVGETMIKKYL
jgi:hypothetical protein